MSGEYSICRVLPLTAEFAPHLETHHFALLFSVFVQVPMPIYTPSANASENLHFFIGISFVWVVSVAF